MSTFLTYNTDDPNAPAGAYATLGSNGNLTLGPALTGVASKIAGSVYSDVAGTCYVQQSFDYLLSGGGVNPNAHWDVSDMITITANQGSKIDLDVIAPVVQVYYVNGPSAQAHLRIFLRAFGVNRG